MFTKIRITMKKFFYDTLGEDLAEVSSSLSKGAKATVACGLIVSFAMGANALGNTTNSATDEAAKKVVAPLGATATPTPTSQSVYK